MRIPGCGLKLKRQPEGNINLGSQGVDNLDLLTAAVGGHIKLAEHVTWSLAYERAIVVRALPTVPL